MNLAIKQSTLYPLAKDIKAIAGSLKYQIYRQLGFVDLKLVNNYLESNEIRKLHIGCGYHPIDGWLNSDYRPIPKDILRLDATKTFPIKNNEFDYIFSEHMIEHISYPQGSSMLQECFRVLRKNGTIRVSTPNLRFLIDLYGSDKTDIQKEYIKYSIDNYIGESTEHCNEVFVINNFFRDWGHQFIYDEQTLRTALLKAGFSNIVKCDLNQSEEESLRNLENESRYPAGFLQMETLTLEGKKLADS